MVSQGVFTYLKDLKPYKSTWRIQVRVLHSWKQYTAHSGESLEVILADETGMKIHGSCKKAYVAKLQKELPLGEWRVIQNFNLTCASGQYRPTEHPFRMSFVGNTVVMPSKLKSNQSFLSLKSFDHIVTSGANTHFLVDVIGQVVDIGQIDTLQCQGGKEKKKIEFHLRDKDNNRIPCVLWGIFADQLSSHCENSDGEAVVCLLRFAKINLYRGNFQISNAFDISKLIIDEDMPEINDFKISLPNDGLALAIVETKNERFNRLLQPKIEWDDIPNKSVSELPSTTEESPCRVICTIHALDTDYAWYYIGHNKCNRKVQHQRTIGGVNKEKKEITELTFYCEFCNATVTDVSAKFKLHIKIKDDTAQTNLMLLDSIAEGIVSHSANQLLNGSFDEMEDPEALPQPLKDLIGQSFEFGVFVKKENIDYGNETYKCGKVWIRTNLLKDECYTECDSQVDTVSAFANPEEVSLITVTSEGKSDISTPSSKRSSEYSLPDLNSSTKKQCTKVVKIEKLTDEEKMSNGEDTKEN